MLSLDIRGTNGSGKSHIIHTLLCKYKFMTLKNREGKSRPWGYYLGALNLYIIGSYENVSGGCDGICDQEEVEARVTEALNEGHNVVFEGLLVSGIFGRWNDYARRMEVRGHKVIIAFMDTPEEVCIARVIQRRLERGNNKSYDPINLTKKNRSVKSARRRFQADGRCVVDVPYESAFTFIEDILKCS